MLFPSHTLRYILRYGGNDTDWFTWPKVPIAEETQLHRYIHNYSDDDSLLAVCSGVPVKDIIGESDSRIRSWQDRCVLSEMEALKSCVCMCVCMTVSLKSQSGQPRLSSQRPKMSVLLKVWKE